MSKEDMNDMKNDFPESIREQMNNLYYCKKCDCNHKPGFMGCSENINYEAEYSRSLMLLPEAFKIISKIECELTELRYFLVKSDKEKHSLQDEINEMKNERRDMGKDE